MATHSSTLACMIPWPEELAGYSPWGCQESNMTEQLTHTHTHTHTQGCLGVGKVYSLTPNLENIEYYTRNIF